MMHWIYSAIIGIVTGYIARMLLPGNDSMGMFKTMLVGVVGAFIGTAIGHATGQIQKDAKAGWIWSIFGAIVILVVMRMLS